MASEYYKVVADYARPTPGIETLCPLTPAAGKAKTALEPGNACLYTSPETTQRFIHVLTLGHVFHRKSPLLVEGCVLNSHGFHLFEVCLAGITTINTALPGDAPVNLLLPFYHRNEALGVCRVTGFYHQIQYQSAFSLGQVKLVTILHLPSVFHDNIGMGLIQTDNLFLCRNLLSLEHPAFSLGYDGIHQRDQFINPGQPVFSLAEQVTIACVTGGFLCRKLRSSRFSWSFWPVVTTFYNAAFVRLSCWHKNRPSQPVLPRVCEK